MNKKLNNNFLKQLIDSDFIFSKSETKIQGQNLTTISLKGNKSYCILDLFKTNTSLKQFIKIVQFLKKTENFHIYINCRNKYLLELIQIFITRYNLSFYVTASDLLPETKIIDERAKFLFVIGKPECAWNKLIVEKALMKGIFLLSNLSFIPQRVNTGLYRIQNDCYDYKKILLLLVIISNILKQRYTLKNNSKKEIY